MSGQLFKIIGYGGLFIGGGVVLMNLAPTEDHYRADKLAKRGAYQYSSSEDAKRANDFTNVILASASTQKTIYGAKQAKEQKLHDKAKQIAIMQEPEETKETKS